MKRIEWLFHILAFALQCGAITPLLLRTSVEANALGASNPLNTFANGFVLVVVLCLLLLHRKEVFVYAPRMWPVLALAALAVLSTAWSDYPDITIRRAASLVTAMLWAWYVTARYDLKDVIAIMRQTIWLTALASLAVGLALPSMGRDDSGGWPGIFATKNSLGIIMALGSTTFFYALLGRGQRVLKLLFWVSGFLLCTGMLYLSQSRTSWLVAMLGIVLCVAIALTYKRVGIAIILWTAIVLLFAPAVIIIMEQLESILPLLGRDSTLTGRVDLWLALPSYIAQRPWLGHGFAAFWVQDSTNVFMIWSLVGWEPPTGHNGWLDLLLELGAAGLALVVVQVLIIFVNGIRAVVDGREPHIRYFIVTTLLILFYNLAESNLVRPDVMWILLVSSAAALAKIAKQREAVEEPRTSMRYRRGRPYAPPQGRRGITAS